MALRLTVGTSSLLINATSATAPALRLAVHQAASKRLYWSWRCARYRGDGIYPHTYAYGRLFRYRHSPDSPTTDDGSLAPAPSRSCNSWTKHRETRGAESPTAKAETDAKGARPDHEKDKNTRLPRRIDWELKSVMRKYLSEQDPTAWRVKLERMLREQPYLSIFGRSEALGAWNPWARKEWRAMWDELEADVREMKADLGIKERPKQVEMAGKTGEPDAKAPRTEPAAGAAEPREGYTFDPIAMRYVKKEENVSVSTAEESKAPAKRKRAGPSWAIPVGPRPVKMTDLSEWEIKALRSKPQTERPSPVGFARQPWLSKEWQRVMTGMTKDKPPVAKEASTMETSLDRMTAQKPVSSTHTDKPSSEDIQGHTKPKARMHMNLPSVTPSASAPTPSHSRSSRASPSSSRQALDNDFDAAQTRFNQELSSVQKPAVSAPFPNTIEARKPSAPSVDDEASATQVKQSLAETLKAVLAAKEALQRAKDDALKWDLDREVRTQKAAMETFESKPREPTSPLECPAADTRVRWPSVGPGSRVEQEQKAREKALVREIRHIYEDTYGTIDVNHRQPVISTEETKEAVSQAAPAILPPEAVSSGTSAVSEVSKSTMTATATDAKSSTMASPESRPPTEPRPSLDQPNRPSPPPTDTPRRPEVYKILAYNKDLDEVTVARTASSIYKNSAPVRSPSQILTHLDQPAKYFDLMETVEATGYELVAGSRRMLVYRRVQPDVAEAPQSTSFTVEARVRAAEPTQKAVHARSAVLKGHSASATAVEKAMSADVVAAELAKLRRSETGKMQSLHEHLRRLERQQRGMEKAAEGLAARFKALEVELQKLSRARPQEAPASPPPSRLARLVRFLSWIPLLILVAALTPTVVFFGLIVLLQLRNMLWTWWVSGRLPW